MADSMEKRREMMMARLESRGKKVEETKQQSKASREKAEKEMEELIEDSRIEIDGGMVNDMTEKRLVEAIALGPSKYLEVRLREVLNDVRKAILEKETQVTSAFTFYTGIKNVPPKGKISPPSPLPAESSDELDEDDEEDEDDSEDEYDKKNKEERKDADVTCIAHYNLESTLEGEDGSSVRLAHLSSCTISISFCPSTVHMESITDCTIIMLPVQTSILMIGCKRVRIFGEAQQIRVHDVEESILSMSVRGSGGFIIENCTQLKIGKCSLTQNGEKVAIHEGDEWKKVKDFNWLAEGQSPNWSLMNENEWLVADIDTRVVSNFLQ